MFTDVVIILIPLLAWAACIAATGRLFKASGRAAFNGYLIGFFFTWLGVVIA